MSKAKYVSVVAVLLASLTAVTIAAAATNLQLALTTQQVATINAAIAAGKVSCIITLTAAQRDVLKAACPDAGDAATLELMGLQQPMRRENATAAVVSNVSKMKHDATQAALVNLR